MTDNDIELSICWSDTSDSDDEGLESMMSGPRRITLVEDEPDIRAIAEIALCDIGGFEVQICASGSEALATIEAFAPDFILLDVMMPEMDGVETFTKLREIESLAEIPIAFMTARSGEEELNEYLAMGAARIIPKPFDPVRLPDEIKAIWTAQRAHAA